MPKSRRKRKRISPAPAPPSSSLWKQETRRRKQWTEANMVSAIEAAKTGMISINKADLHGVPRTSLKDRLSGKTVHGTNQVRSVT